LGQEILEAFSERNIPEHEKGVKEDVGGEKEVFSWGI